MRLKISGDNVLKIQLNLRNVFICVCVFFPLASVCLQIATLASEDQVELFQRLSFERGRCDSPCQTAETLLCA